MLEKSTMVCIANTYFNFVLISGVFLKCYNLDGHGGQLPSNRI